MHQCIMAGRESCRAEQGQGRSGHLEARTGALDHDSRNPVQIAPVEDDAIPKAMGVCVRANRRDHCCLPYGGLAGLAATKMADITLRWSPLAGGYGAAVDGLGRVQEGVVGALEDGERRTATWHPSNIRPSRGQDRAVRLAALKQCTLQASTPRDDR
jgi:hypothetical protein